MIRYDMIWYDMIHDDIYDILYDVILYDMIYDTIWYMIYLLIAIGLHPLAAVQYTFTHKQNTEQHN